MKSSVRGFLRVLGGLAMILMSVAVLAQTYDVLVNFMDTNDAYPYAGLIQATDGNLYGTTNGSGPGSANAYGTIFKMDTDGTALTILHSFAYSDGAYPVASLIQRTDGNLYGTTSHDGEGHDYGTIFKIDTNGTVFTTLHSFAFTDGVLPLANLIQGTDGNLYGTTIQGGAGGDTSGRSSKSTRMARCSRRCLVYTVMSVYTKEEFVCVPKPSPHSRSQRRPSCCWPSPERPHREA